MDVKEAIFTRRAVRSYTGEKVSEKLVRELLEAAIEAPSAVNSQPWAFLVIQKPEMLRRISDSAKKLLLEDPKWREWNKAHGHHGPSPLTDPGFDIFYGATTLIVICAESEGFGPVGDCYLAGENIMLAARGLGLATCPIGFARDILQTEEWRRELRVTAGLMPVLPIIVGYPAAETPATERRPPRVLDWVK